MKIKKISLLIATLCFLLTPLNLFASSQKAKRIVFKKGATQAIVTGYLTGYHQNLIYVIKVRQGQRLETSSDDSITVAITDPNGENVTDSDASCNKNKIVEPTIAGDYRIIVHECMKANPWRGNFKMKVSVE